MFNSFFIFRSLTAWDKISISLYIAVSLGLWYCLNNSISIHIKRNYLFAYGIGTHLYLYLFNYRSLRNLSAYLVWCFIGVIHLAVYLRLYDDPTLFNLRGHSATPLRNTIGLLVLFQVLRLASIKIQKKELVAPSGMRTDLFDERPVTMVDFLFFIIYFVSATFFLYV